MNNIYDIQVTTDLTAEPVTLEAVKDYLHVDFNEDDIFIQSLISSARRRLERYTGVSFGVKTIKVFAELFNSFELPYGPVTSVTSVNLVTDGSTTLVTDYYLKGNEFKIIDTNSCGDYEIIYVTGWATLPEDLQLAIMTEVAFRYENRGDEIIGLSAMSKSLASTYRRLTTI